MHLNRTLSDTKDPPYLLFRHFNEETEKENFAFLSYEDPFPDDHFSNSKHPNFVNPKPYWQDYEFFDYPSDFIELHCPYKSSNEFWFIVGISNGLVCMVDDTPSNTPYDIVPILWNPSIHKSVFLPSPGVRFPSSYEPMEYLGFGYDPITDDYKVVRLVYLHGWDERSFQGEEPSVVQIYSLRTNAWRTIPGPGHRYIIKEQSLSVFVNGSVHWLAHVGNVDTDSEDDYSDDDPPCNVIFTFNIRDEVFCKMDVPKYYEDTFDLNMMVALVGDKLALVPDLENVVGFAKNEVIVNKFCRTYAKAHAKTKEIKEKRRFSNTYKYVADWRILIKADEETVGGVELKEMEMGSTRFCYISKASGAGTSLETELAATTENIGPSRRHQENTAARSPNHSVRSTDNNPHRNHWPSKISSQTLYT
nr:f-box/kelch-repeat protein [Quercus suber]